MPGVLVSSLSQEPLRFARQTRYFQEAAQLLPARSFVMVAWEEWVTAVAKQSDLRQPLPCRGLTWNGSGWEWCEQPLSVFWDRLSGMSAPLRCQQRLQDWEARGLRLSNPTALTELCWDKWSTYQLCLDGGIPTPATRWLEETALVDSLGWEGNGVWLKPRRGSQGRGVSFLSWEALQKQRESLLQLAKEEPEQWLLQAEIPGAKQGKEFRVWLQRHRGGGWEIVAAVWRTAGTPNALNNLSQGGHYSTPVFCSREIPPGFWCLHFLENVEKRLGERASLGCEIVMDFLQRGEEWFLLEANSKPGHSIDRLGTEEARRLREALVRKPLEYLLSLSSGRTAE